MECDADAGDGPPACVADQFAGVESDEEAGALLCGGLLNRGTCSDDENAVIDEATASMCGGGGGGDGDCLSSSSFWVVLQSHPSPPPACLPSRPSVLPNLCVDGYHGYKLPQQPSLIRFCCLSP